MKNVLVVYFSQSGQLTEIVNNFITPLRNQDNISVDHYAIEMLENFPFPWTNDAFFDVFPESFLMIPEKIKPIPQSICQKNYDLIILAYQVWYLSPSIPINSFLNSDEGKKIIQNKPIITLSASRNMWTMAQQKVKNTLNQCNAQLVGNIALTDRNINHISVITIVHWMFTGKKERRWGILPPPGVSQKDISTASIYGNILIPYLNSGNYDQMQAKIVQNGAVHLKYFLISADKKANRLFSIWAKKIHKSPRRKLLLKIFKIYLYIAIWVLMPIVMLFYWLTMPLCYPKRRKEFNKIRYNI
ncbi:dialkylrecorsinol condensing enzyme DarA [Capnocytophaga sp.]|uniref:dialkylrecorsinol condensing enzyme DarA n=1 Tax=Capnocytophaga sp. TaxID=44737 RepID=UPI0026DD37B8|nr:dialkylrecorsinol condensing enzyme DarA [Capnocytophaga sp.]MDO5106249.1 dialkylresorcinol condensing enzyme DarA [Capnocytophaga sp.]